MWFLTLPPAHTCFTLATGEWLLVYTCVSAQKPRGSCTNTLLCYPCIAVALACSGIPTAGCLYTYLTKSSDCHNTPTWSLKTLMTRYRCQVHLNRCQTEFMWPCRVLSLSVYMPVSMLKSLHCGTHLFHFKVFVWNKIFFDHILYFPVLCPGNVI